MRVFSKRQGYCLAFCVQEGIDDSDRQCLYGCDPSLEKTYPTLVSITAIVAPAAKAPFQFFISIATLNITVARSTAKSHTKSHIPCVCYDEYPLLLCLRVCNRMQNNILSWHILMTITHRRCYCGDFINDLHTTGYPTKHTVTPAGHVLGFKI